MTTTYSPDHYASSRASRQQDSSPYFNNHDTSDSPSLSNITPTMTDRKGKKRLEAIGSAFSRLPREIIQQIMYMCDPNTFDSLTLVNSAWYLASRSVYLYAHHLQTCGIDTSLTLDETPEVLSQLVYQFGLESRRGLFESMLRPQVTEIEIICNSLSSSGAVPGGEVFRYDFSPRGNFLLAISSSRIFVLDLSTPSADLPISVKRELKIARRPMSAAILDDGSIMAVLSSSHRVSLYDLTGEKVVYMKSVDLENEPRTIALSPGAAVLAVAYEGGIEVLSLAADESMLAQSRAVKCEDVDALCFSLDGTVLMGSTLNSSNHATVIISAPFLSQDLPISELLSQMWTTQILFPRSSRDNSHAALLPHHGENSSWTFTYDKVFAAFRAVLVDDLRNGHTYFAAPATDNLLPTSLPAPSLNGGIVASGFGNKSVFVYGVPSNLESTGDGTEHSTGSSTPFANPGNGTQWQHSSPERLRNTFVYGRKIGDVEGLVGMKFARSSRGERLVAVAAGLTNMIADEDDEAPALGGGRLVFFDFGRGPRVGKKAVIGIELGDGSYKALETLEEQQTDLDAEVNIARRRTVAQRNRGGRLTNTGILPSIPTLDGSLLASRSTPSLLSTLTSSLPRHATLEVDENAEETDTVAPGEAVDLPYSQTDPRSQTLLHRAATAAAANAAHTPRRRLDAEPQQSASVTNYRLLGLKEEVWQEPPPLYSESLEKTALYDYEARLIEHAASLGITNPNNKIRNMLERSHTSPAAELGQFAPDNMVTGSSSTEQSTMNRTPSVTRGVLPALRITSPVSPSSTGLARTGSVSRNGSISAGAITALPDFPTPISERPRVSSIERVAPVLQYQPANVTPPRRQTYFPPPDANVRVVADQDLPPVPSYNVPNHIHRRQQSREGSQTMQEVNSWPVQRPSTQPRGPSQTSNRSFSASSLTETNVGSRLMNFSTVSIPDTRQIEVSSSVGRISPDEQRISPLLERTSYMPYTQPMLSRLPSHRGARRTDTFTVPTSSALDASPSPRNNQFTASTPNPRFQPQNLDTTRQRSESASSYAANQMQSTQVINPQFMPSSRQPQQQSQTYQHRLSYPPQTEIRASQDSRRTTGSAHSQQSYLSDLSNDQQSPPAIQSISINSDHAFRPQKQKPGFSLRNLKSPTPTDTSPLPPPPPILASSSPQRQSSRGSDSRSPRRARHRENRDSVSSTYINPAFMIEHTNESSTTMNQMSITIPASGSGSQHNPPMPLIPPIPPSLPSPGPGRHGSQNRRSAGVSRKPSRAERSAAKNVRDAKMKKMAKKGKKDGNGVGGKEKGLCVIC